MLQIQARIFPTGGPCKSWRYWKYIEEPEFGPNPPIHTIVFLTETFTDEACFAGDCRCRSYSSNLSSSCSYLPKFSLGFAWEMPLKISTLGILKHSLIIYRISVAAFLENVCAYSVLSREMILQRTGNGSIHTWHTACW